MVLTCGCQTIGLSYPILLPLPRGYAIAPKKADKKADKKGDKKGDKKSFTVPSIIDLLEEISADRNLNTGKYKRRYRPIKKKN